MRYTPTGTTFSADMMMADPNQPDTFYMPPMFMSFPKEHSSSIFSREPSIALTGWGHDRTDGPNHKQTDKPAIRNYVCVGTTTKTFGDADVGDIAHPSLIEDWDHTVNLQTCATPVPANQKWSYGEHGCLERSFVALDLHTMVFCACCVPQTRAPSSCGRRTGQGRINRLRAQAL